MVYRILRNNKEQGPYNLDELLQLSLRPYDLIWVEGKSASWRYPTEIDTLIPYLGTNTSIIATQQKVSLADVPPKRNDAAIVNISNPSIQEEELTAALLEKKANAIYQRIQAYNAQCEQEAKDVQTKYARSLEDLKQDYADWLHKKKRRNRSVTLDNKGWMALGAMCTAFIFFILAGRDKDLSTTGLSYQLNTESSENAKEPTGKELIKKKSHAKNKVEVRNISQQSTIDQFIDSVRQVLNKKELFLEPLTSKIAEPKPISINGKHTDTQTLIITPTLIDATQVPNVPMPEADMNAFYTLSETGERIKDVHVTVTNTGNIILKEITVDIIYLKNKTQVISTESLQFNNIDPGNAATITKPGHKKATAVKFKIGKLSS